MLEGIEGRFEDDTNDRSGSLTARMDPLARATTRDGRVAGRSLRILVVEDNRTNQLVMRHLLKSVEGEVALAENGREAVELAMSAHYDVILMDIQMPLLDGVEAARQIRAIERADPIRSRAVILATTANTMTDQIAEYGRAGMDGWLAKPIAKDRLLTAITERLN
ncbi:response regulator [Palleronia sp. LCG004]|uniref:response regulator n=1 Tax=Palleronia sp. LCG004 TaxID=3079304 RepID=UPI002941F81B|nr:response regulator [Palleronia sp. LCG004]WOI58053.1 response regulator [Palleronia sp. LCG004]